MIQQRKRKNKKWFQHSNIPSKYRAKADMKPCTQKIKTMGELKMKINTDMDISLYEGEDEALKRITSKKKKKIILSMDTEDDTKGNLLYIVQYDGKIFHTFTDQYTYLLYLRKLSTQYRQRNVYIACVNLEYDIINAFRGYFEFIEFSYGASLIFCRMKNTRIYFYDTLNHYKMGVKKQGDILGIKKLGDTIDVTKLKRDAKTLEYCKRDTEITYKFANYYQEALNDIGCNMRFTIASSAMDLYRRKFLKYNCFRIKDVYLDKIRQAYSGGRTEIFKMKAKGNIHYVDINSLYPYVMSSFEYPDVNSMFIEKGIECEGVSDVMVEYCKDINVPYLPVKFAGKLLFPLGKFRGWWSNFELRYGVEKGLFKIKKIYESIQFKYKVDYFSEYVSTLYGMRKKYKDDKSPKGQFYNISLKLLMNSLYGKFGEEVAVTDLIFESGELKEIVEKEKYYPVHTNYILSLYVTAYARTVLWEGLNKIDSSGGKLLYCDTDSIMYIGEKNVLPLSNELGDFKYEGNFKSAEFFQPKNYILYDKDNKPKVACKGVPREQSLQYIESAIAYMSRPVRLRESFRRKNKMLIPNLWIEKVKKLTSSYDKRIITKGNNTKPLKFPDDMELFKIKGKDENAKAVMSGTQLSEGKDAYNMALNEPDEKS